MKKNVCIHFEGFVKNVMQILIIIIFSLSEYKMNYHLVQ